MYTYRRHTITPKSENAILQCFGKSCCALVSQKLINNTFNKPHANSNKIIQIFTPRTSYTNYSKVKFINTEYLQESEQPLPASNKNFNIISKERKSVLEKYTKVQTKFEKIMRDIPLLPIAKPSSVCSNKNKIRLVSLEEKSKRRNKICEYHRYFDNLSKNASDKCIVDMSKQTARKSFMGKPTRLKNMLDLTESIDFRKLQKKSNVLEFTLSMKEIQSIRQEPKAHKQYTDSLISNADRLNIINIQ